MTPDDIYNGITNIPDDMIEEAEEAPQRKRHWGRWTALAAALALVIGVASLLPRMGGSAAKGGSMGGQDGRTYHSYAGPVFPLTALGNPTGITAERNTTLDFSPYRTQPPDEHGYERWNDELLVTDSYILSNTTDEDQQLTLLYPFAGSFTDPEKLLPTLTADGTEVIPTIHAGPYSGRYQSAGGDSESLNLAQLQQFSDFEALLSDGRYLENALEAFPVLEQPVIVYRLSDYEVAPTDAENPTLQISYYVNYNATKIMTFGSNGGTINQEDGWGARHVGSLGNEYRPPEDLYLVLLGDDLTEYTVQGYADGGCDPGEEIDIACTVTRYESTLGQMLRQFTESFAGYYQPEEDTIEMQVPTELVYGCICELMVDHGILSSNPAERYDFGMLEDYLSEARSMKRVFYLAFDVAIPAGGSVELTASMTKESSFDFHGGGGDDPSHHGYELATQLGSSLTFSSQWASIQGTEYIEILHQNYGFDPENGITQVELDAAVPCYWLQVCKRKE